MTGIWINDGTGWGLASSEPFSDEKTLQSLVAANPQLLPLAGSPQVIVLGTQVNLGTGYADILAVETSGRPVIVEVKLRRNPEARRAIVAQALAYAAFLQGNEVSDLEGGPLAASLQSMGVGSIAEAVASEDQTGAADPSDFSDALQAFLDSGRFRLVLVLDEVPSELEYIVAYLDAITDQAVTIDLITVGVFERDGTQIAMPQRISREIRKPLASRTELNNRVSATPGVESLGSEVFRASVESADEENRAIFDRLIEWCEELDQYSKVRLYTYSGVKRIGLLPRIRPGNGGLVTISNDLGVPGIRVWRSVFERLAPNTISAVEAAISPAILGKGTMVRDFSPTVLDSIASAYEEAASETDA